MLADHLDLFAYNRWAHERTLRAAESLSTEALRRPLGGSFDSVLATLLHLHGAEYSWLARWLGAAAGAVPDFNGVDTVAALHARWDEFWPRQAAFLEQLKDADLARPVAIRTRTGIEATQPLAITLMHVVNHATYHRGQVVTLLRQLSAEPVATDYFLYYEAKAKGRG